MIPADTQLFPAYGPLVETAGIEPARSSRRDAPPRLTAFSLQFRGSEQVHSAWARVLMGELWAQPVDVSVVVDGLVVRP